MRFPRSIRISGKEWRVRRRHPKNMGDAVGLTHYDKSTLDIATGQSAFDVRDTTLHETFHAILAQQGRTYGDEVEETYVCALATGLMGVIQDNPEFVRWLTRPLHKPQP